MAIDVIGDFLTIMRNGLRITKHSVVAPLSQEKLGIAQVLKDEGFIKDYQVIDRETSRPQLKVFLKYIEGEPVIHEITRVSKPGRRHYEKAKNIKFVVGGLGIAILSTNQGIITDKKARQLSVGGEIYCHVW